MKKTFTMTALILMAVNLCAQRPEEPYKLAFRNGTELLLTTTDLVVDPLGDGLNLRAEAIDRNSTVYTYSTMPTEVLETLTTDLTFYQAIEDGNGDWVVLERDMESTAYDVVRFDLHSGERTVLFTDRSAPDGSFAFRPIASPAPNMLLLEKLVFGSADEHLGIWSLDLATNAWREIVVNPGYLTTPKVSPDGKYLAYVTTSELPKDLHSAATATIIQDIPSGKEMAIAAPAGSWSEVLGWVPGDMPAKDLLKPDTGEEPEGMLKMQPTFELPWNTGVTYYVSRTGTPAPSGSTGSTCYQNYGYTPHTYMAIDFDSPNGVTDPVRASAAGTVTFAGINGSLTSGYGRLVKIRHSDDTFSFYAHLNTIYVAVGDVVQQGCAIGDGGTTGGSTGDHIHFEWRDVGEAQFNSSSMYPIFSECGCRPKANYCYTSANSSGSCSSGGSTGANLYKTTSSLSVSASSVSINVTVVNNGTANAASSSLGYYLSTNTTISSSDYLIGTDAVSSLTPGATSPESITVSLCNLTGVPNGTYYVGYAIDRLNAVAETNETENNRYWSSPKPTRSCSNMGLGSTAGMVLVDDGDVMVVKSLDLNDDAGVAGLESVGVFPNPSQGEVTFSIPIDMAGPVRIDVLNGLGQSLAGASQLVAGQTETLDLSMLPDGLYHARLTTASASHTVRLVIQR